MSKNKMMSPEEAMKNAENNGISFSGENSLDEKSLDKRFAKVRITTMIDLLLKEKLKEEAALAGTKYQVLLNDILKQYFEKKEGLNLQKRLEKVENTLEKIMTKTG